MPIRNTPALQTAVLALFLVGCSSTLVAQSYTDERFNRGREALSDGNHSAAITELELACLGMMEVPPSYAHCKSLLFLAQLGGGQKRAARATLLLIARLEEDYSAYSDATLTDASRTTFEAAAQDNFSSETLRQTPRFAAILQSSALPATPGPSTTDTDRPLPLASLKRQASENPQDIALQEQLALRLYRAEKIVDALRAAEDLNAKDLGNHNAQCIRATVRSARNHSLCSSFIEQIANCPQTLHTPFYVETRLRCYKETKNWNLGRDYLHGLSAESRSAAHVEGLARRIVKRADAVEANTPETESVQTNGTRPQQSTDSQPTEAIEFATQGTQTAPAETELANDQPNHQILLNKIAATRARAAKALSDRDRGSLSTSLNQAVALADQNPTVIEAQQLSGELAYLLTDWQTTVDYLMHARQLGDIGVSHIFYLAAAFHEVGNTPRAADFLQESLDRGLVRTPIVNTYERKIFGNTP